MIPRRALLAACPPARMHAPAVDVRLAAAGLAPGDAVRPTAVVRSPAGELRPRPGVGGSGAR